MSLYLGDNLISGSKPINLGVRNIGEIVYSSLPLTDAGLHLLDGSLILGGGIYQGFVDYITELYTANPSANYFTDETTWQTSVNTYGVCGKFVYDSVNNTVRLPKITGIIEGATDVTALGDLVEAGLPSLPNHTHSISIPANAGWNGTNYLGSSDRGSIDRYFGYTTSNPSWGSSNFYGKSSTVQPQTIKAFYYIVIANSTKTNIEVDIDEVTTDLNNKVDLDGTNATFPHIVETYQNGTSWYRVYSDGWCEQGGVISSNADGSTTFLKPFVNTAYILNYQINVYSQNARMFTQFGYNKTTTGFSYSTAGIINNTWQACGYIA